MTDNQQRARIGLIGAGNIADVHAQALRSIGFPITAVIEPNPSVRETFARKWNVTATFATLDEALAAEIFDRAHVLTPPATHTALARQLQVAGRSALVEKPLATTQEDCSLLLSADRGGLGVNQNFVYHPAFAKLRRALKNKQLGRPQFVNVVYHAPLRQMAARQFGHWMFLEPRNILLEQAVHPISQIVSLCGDLEKIEAVAEAPLEIAPGRFFYSSFTASMIGTRLPVSLRFAVAQNFPLWQVSVICDDGVIVADILVNRCWTVQRTRWLEMSDNLMSGFRTAAQIVGQSTRNFLNYSGSMAGLRERDDGFFQSMRASIAAFHGAIDAGHAPELDAKFGSQVVGVCDRIAGRIMEKPFGSARPLRTGNGPTKPDVAVLGGTGFIGAALVSRLRARNLTVSVMARNVANLPAVFDDDGVRLHRGDIRNISDIEAAATGASVIVNLAHGGASGSWEQIRDAMLGGAQNVAKACVRSGAKRLVHVGSIAALYLGPQPQPVTGATSPDPKSELRADYARAKAMCDTYLLNLHAQEALPVCILRPGLVVGEGTSPFHSGLGFFNNEQHCIGWNQGRNPLPFVLVEDVADAIIAACFADSVDGVAFNLVGDVRPTAREYIAILGRTLQRPLKYHPKIPQLLYTEELGKWLVKRVAGRKAPLPSLRDLLSRGLRAEFDCTDAKHALNWAPQSEPDAFYKYAIAAGE